MEGIALLLGTGWVITAVCLYRLLTRLKTAEIQIGYLNESSVGTYNKEKLDNAIFPHPSKHLRNSNTTFLASRDDVEEMTSFLNGKITAIEEHLKLKITQVPTEQKKFTVTKRK